MQEAETRYQMMEKVALALVLTARRMRPYFQNHEVVVRTDYPIARILSKPDLAGRMITWSIELSEFAIRYEPKGAIKAQVLADFIAEMRQEPSEPEVAQPAWTVYVNGSSNSKGAGAGVVLEGPGGLLIEQSLRFGFNTSNNQAEYEALIAGLELARDMGEQEVVCKSDSRLTVGHITGEFQVKDPLLSKYYHKVRALLQDFSSGKVEHIRREHNARAYLLSKLASTKKRSHHKSLIQQALEAPSIDEKELVCCISKTEAAWFEPIRQFLLTGQCAESEERKMWAKSSRFTMVGSDLYRRGYTRPLLKCITQEEAQYVLRELYQGICGIHTGTRSTLARILRAGYYWPTMKDDYAEYTKKCEKCQEFGGLIHSQPEHLHSITPPWSFAMWGMDIIGPFPPEKGQCRFLLIGVDYFTKWIEAEPLATITAAKVKGFVWKGIVSRFGIPHTIVSNNGRQFIDRTLVAYYEELGIIHVTSSVEHPQTNGQAEATNKVILNELKKRLGTAKGRWPEELLQVLWAYRCTPQSTTGETPYSMVYETNTMIPVEVGEPTIRRQLECMNLNNENLMISLDTIRELREKAQIREQASKARATLRYNTKIKPRSFHPGHLVWRMRSDARKNDGKFSANWEGPFRIVAVAGKGAYRLEYLSGKAVPRTWNATHLKFYFS